MRFWLFLAGFALFIIAIVDNKTGGQLEIGILSVGGIALILASLFWPKIASMMSSTETDG